MIKWVDVFYILGYYSINIVLFDTVKRKNGIFKKILPVVSLNKKFDRICLRKHISNTRTLSYSVVYMLMMDNVRNVLF